MATYYGVNDDSYLAHHGVKGMKWGVRHDNPSGSTNVRLTARNKIIGVLKNTNMNRQSDEELSTIDSLITKLVTKKDLKTNNELFKQYSDAAIRSGQAKYELDKYRKSFQSRYSKRTKESKINSLLSRDQTFLELNDNATRTAKEEKRTGDAYRKNLDRLARQVTGDQYFSSYGNFVAWRIESIP